MKKIPFDEKELTVLREIPDRHGLMREYAKPISEGDNMRLLFQEDHPMWIPCNRAGTVNFSPNVYPDNVARNFGGTDMYGVNWVFVPVVNGAMEDPGIPHLLTDVNDWPKVIRFPDVDSWDWAGSRAENLHVLQQKGKWITSHLLNGCWFERLISFMGFENAALAMIDDDQADALLALFDKTTEVMERIVDKFAEYFPEVDDLLIHDDWGAQRAPFFSEEAARKFIVPYMKRLSDYVKSKGFVAELHSCGHNESRVQCYIDGGWQCWGPQPMNDTEKLFQEYGDKIVITIELKLPADLTEEQQRDAAKRFAETHCVPGKKLRLTFNSNLGAFDRELYKQSRLAYLSF